MRKVYPNQVQIKKRKPIPTSTLTSPESVAPIPVEPAVPEPAPTFVPRPDQVRFFSVAKAEKFWIDKARYDPAFFCHYLLGKEPAKHHLIWLKEIFDFSKEGRSRNSFRLNLIAPRDSAKSSITMMAMTWFISRFPFTSNMIISVSSSQAEKRAEMIRDFIQHDARYHNVFPHVYVDENQRNNIREFTLGASALFDVETNTLRPVEYKLYRSLVKRVGSPKDPTMYVSGVGGKGVIGHRVSGMMILDDIIDEAYLKSELQNDIYEYIMRTLIPCLQDSAKAINIGTRWMPDDVPEKLKNNPEWKTIEIQAIRHDEKGQPMSYWPEYWPLEKLEKRRLEMDNDALFRVMYLNDPTAFTDAKFTVEGISQRLPVPLPPMKYIYVGTDFAISTKTSADWTVFSAVGLDEHRNIYILDMRRIKATPDVVVQELGLFVNQTADRYGKVDQVLIEKVAFQGTMQVMILEKFPHLPVRPIPPIGDKGTRATVFAQKCNDLKVYFNTNSPAYTQFKSEAMNFGLSGVKDDIIDSITIVIQHLGSSIQNVRTVNIRSPLLL